MPNDVTSCIGAQYSSKKADAVPQDLSFSSQGSGYNADDAEPSNSETGLLAYGGAAEGPMSCEYRSAAPRDSSGTTQDNNSCTSGSIQQNNGHTSGGTPAKPNERCCGAEDDNQPNTPKLVAVLEDDTDDLKQAADG